MLLKLHYNTFTFLVQVFIKSSTCSNYKSSKKVAFLLQIQALEQTGRGD